MSKSKAAFQEEVEHAVLSWFTRMNMPATKQSMVDGLQSKYSKPSVQKALDTLLECGRISSKDFKKIRLFFVDPLKSEEAAETEAAVSISAEDVCQLDAAVKRADVENETLGTRIAHEKSQRSVEELEADVYMLGARAAELYQRIEAIRKVNLGDKRGREESEEDPTEIAKTAIRYIAQWKIRKRLVVDILDSLGDTSSLGVVKDAEAGVSVVKCEELIHKRLLR